MTTAQTIVTADEIVTMDEQSPSAEAIAISQGRIIAVGSSDDVMRQKGPETEVVELGDVCVLPGLIEPHTHPDLCAQCYAWVDVSGFTHKDVAGVEKALLDAAAQTPKGEWIYAFGLDPMLTEDIGTWGRKRLDEIVPDHPAAVMIP